VKKIESLLKSGCLGKHKTLGNLIEKACRPIFHEILTHHKENDKQID
jgi:hypothetical protein